ncbi:hypothetical protein LV83_02052 [Algoriphagus yeomjeoni]|uniref:Uncharacterized protein n=1 Tax=Algoriphagus yeomjeoni TaxID=291403 RepID=A0A327PCV0_9BACT|nr:hypothetical protein LV83_02052 [Algoriphagus yeomjeoni]
MKNINTFRSVGTSGRKSGTIRSYGTIKTETISNLPTNCPSGTKKVEVKPHSHIEIIATDNYIK